MRSKVVDFNDDLVDGVVDLLKRNIIPRIKTFGRLYGKDLFAEKFLVEEGDEKYRSHENSLVSTLYRENYKLEQRPMDYRELTHFICSGVQQYLDLKIAIYNANLMDDWFLYGLEENFNILKGLHYLFYEFSDDPLQNFTGISEDDMISKLEGAYRMKNQIEYTILKSVHIDSYFEAQKLGLTGSLKEEKNRVVPAPGNFDFSEGVHSEQDIYSIPSRYKPYNMRIAFFFRNSDRETNGKLSARNRQLKIDFFHHVYNHYPGIYIGKEIDKCIYRLKKINQIADRLGLRFGLVPKVD